MRNQITDNIAVRRIEGEEQAYEVALDGIVFAVITRGWFRSGGWGWTFSGMPFGWTTTPYGHATIAAAARQAASSFRRRVLGQ